MLPYRSVHQLFSEWKSSRQDDVSQSVQQLVRSRALNLSLLHPEFVPHVLEFYFAVFCQILHMFCFKPETFSAKVWLRQILEVEITAFGLKNKQTNRDKFDYIFLNIYINICM